MVIYELNDNTKLTKQIKKIMDEVAREKRKETILSQLAKIKNDKNYFERDYYIVTYTEILKNEYDI